MVWAEKKYKKNAAMTAPESTLKEERLWLFEFVPAILQTYVGEMCARGDLRGKRIRRDKYALESWAMIV